nr:defensin-like protein 159 [Ipomoea batatas]
MKLQHFFLFSVLSMAILVSSGESVIMSEDEGRCMAVMESDGCNLSSCKLRCFQVKNGNGVCLAKLREGYQCMCYFNC